MTVLITWLAILVAGSWLGEDKGEEVRIFRRQLFFSATLILGILGLISPFGRGGIGLLENSFKPLGLEGAFEQCLIFMPLLVLLSQLYQKKESGPNAFLGAGAMIAMTSYHFAIIFAALAVYGLFFIAGGEGRDAPFKSLKKEATLLLLVILPWVVDIGVQQKFMPSSDLYGVFFLIFVMLNVFDLWSINCTKKSEAEQRGLSLQNLILIFPLRMAVLVYCVASGLGEEYLLAGKIILFITLAVSISYGIISRFELRSLFTIVEVLLLMSVLSGPANFFMGWYFVLGISFIYSTRIIGQPERVGGIHWPFMGPLLIIVLSLVNGPVSLANVLTLIFAPGYYSNSVGWALMGFFSLLIFQWGQSLNYIQDTRSLRIKKKEWPLMIFLFLSLFLSIKYSVVESFTAENWSSRVILACYFVIVFLLSYIVDAPKPEGLQNKRWGRYFGRVESFLTRSNVNNFPSNIVANLCLPLSRGGWAISFFIQDIVANAFVVMVDIYESRGVRKYQHLAMLLLVAFLFLWLKVFVEGR